MPFQTLIPHKNTSEEHLNIVHTKEICTMRLTALFFHLLLLHLFKFISSNDDESTNDAVASVEVKAQAKIETEKATIDANAVAALQEKLDILTNENTKLSAELNNVQSDSTKKNENSEIIRASLESQLLESSNKAAAVGGLYEKCTVNSNAVKSNVEVLESKLSSVDKTVDILQKEIDVFRAMNSQLEEKFESKLIVLDGCENRVKDCNTKKDDALESSKKFVSLHKEADDLANRMNTTLDASRARHVKEIVRLEKESEDWEEKYKNLKEQIRKTDVRVRDAEHNSRKLERELKDLQSVEQPYCNVTLIYEDTKETADHYYHVCATKFSHHYVVISSFVSNYTSIAYAKSEIFINEHIIPIVNRLYSEFHPFVSSVSQQIYRAYMSNLHPTVIDLQNKGQELYNENAKEHVDKHVFPVYKEHIAPLFNVAVAKGKAALAVAEPEIKLFLLKAQEFCVGARLFAISLTKEISRDLISFLKGLKANDGGEIAPEWMIHGLTYVRSEAPFLLDFLVYVFGIFTLFRYRAFVLKLVLFLPLLPFRLVFRRGKSTKKKNKKKKVVVKQEKQSPYGRKKKVAVKQEKQGLYGRKNIKVEQ